MTRVYSDGSPGEFRVEGVLRRDDVEELRRALRGTEPDLVLDLSGVTFTDAAGTACIPEMRDGGARLTGCRGLVKELLRQTTS